MASVLLPEEAIEELAKTNELLSYIIATCEILQGHISDISKLIQNRKDVIKACKEKFLEPFTKAIEGVSKNDENYPPRGTGAGAGTGILYNNKAVECVSESYARVNDPTLLKVTQRDLPDGAYSVSIPDFVAEKIGQKADTIREIISRFDRVVRGLRDPSEFDFNMGEERSYRAEERTRFELRGGSDFVPPIYGPIFNH